MDHEGSDSTRSWHPANMPNTLQKSDTTPLPQGLGFSQEKAISQGDHYSHEGHSSSGPGESQNDEASSSKLELSSINDVVSSSSDMPKSTPPVTTTSTTATPKSPEASQDIDEAKDQSSLRLPESSETEGNAGEEGENAGGANSSLAKETNSPLEEISRLDRSNSFPDVPLATSTYSHPPSLPHSQVEEILEGDAIEDSLVEDEEVLFPQYAQQRDLPPETTESRGDVISQQYESILDEPPLPTQDESRFEEGLPLLPTSDSSSDAPFATYSSPESDVKIEAPHSDEGTGFFAKSSSETPHAEVPQEPHRLDRKTTGDVLGAMSFASAADEPDFSDILKGDDPNADMDSLEGHVQDVGETKVEDLDAVWQAALGDDDLLDDEPSLDPKSFFGDDASEFLSEIQGENSTENTHYDHSRHTASQHTIDTRYGPTPSMVDQQGELVSRYLPEKPAPVRKANLPNGVPQSHHDQGNLASPQSSHFDRRNGPLPERPRMPESTQSFADKSKGGYTSPYDLPIDVSRPAKKRNFTGQGRSGTGPNGVAIPQLPPPPRSSSMYANISPIVQSPPPLPTLQAAPTAPNKARPAVTAQKSGFFEELPATQPRPASRPSQPPSSKAPLLGASVSPQTFRNSQGTQRPQSSSSDGSHSFGLVPPSKVGPYAAAPDQTPNAPPLSAPLNSRYSPAPPQQQGVPPPRNRYAASPSSISRAPPPPAVPFQPRTSSPLAQKASVGHDEVGNTNSHVLPDPSASVLKPTVRSPPSGKSMLDQAQSSYDDQLNPRQYEAALHRQQDRAPSSLQQTTVQPFLRQNGHESGTNVAIQRETSAVASKYISSSQVNKQDYQPRTHPVAAETQFVPPPRSLTQSPGAVRPRGSLAELARESLQRPASVNERPSNLHQNSYQPGVQPAVAPSASLESDTTEYLKPNNETQYDPLERWKGSPIFHFAFGGAVISSLPVRIPRYTAGVMRPSILCATGDVRIHDSKAILSDEHLGAFPGPLKGKGKKKDVMDWLQKKTAQLQSLSHGMNPDQEQALEERYMLWQLIRILVEHDGAIEGKPNAEKAARLILFPQLSDDHTDLGMGTGSHAPSISRSGAIPQSSDSADPEAMEALRKLLLQGEREKAVYYALDRRLWAHAMLISSTMDKGVWKQVLQEFVRQEVKTAGDNTESLAALYQIFAGNWEESVDELVPPSARAGMQLISKAAAPGVTKNALDGLNKWRETVTLSVGNPVPGDGQAMAALGRLLTSYGRVEAAHICFLFAKNSSLFGPPEDPNTAAFILGINHSGQPNKDSYDVDSIMLTEVFDFANNVLRNGSAPSSLHMQLPRLYHAYTLAERGFQAQALAYCDELANFVRSAPKGHLPYLGRISGPLDDLSGRLRQAPSSTAGSWMARPTMDKVSGSLMSRFTSFVAGEDSDAESTESGKLQAIDPFAKATGDTPGVSPSPSSGDLYGSYAAGDPYASARPSMTAAGSRYAPSGIMTPRSSLDQGGRPHQVSPRALPGDASKAPLQQQRTYNPVAPVLSGEVLEGPQQEQYKPPPHQPHFNAAQSYLPTPPLQSEQLSPPMSSPYAPMSGQGTPSIYSPQLDQQPRNGPHQPPLSTSTDQPHDQVPDAEYNKFSENTTQSHMHLESMPQSNGYEPPSSTYMPYSPPAESSSSTSPRKKKSFMDLSDDEDFSTQASAAATKPDKAASKAPSGREPDAAFLAAVDADAKKAQTLQPKKSGWFGGIFGGKKSEDLGGSGGSSSKNDSGAPGAPIKAKLGEQSSFYYDKELKRWVNPNAGPDAASAATPTPPPPRGGPPPSRAVSGSGVPPPPRSAAPTPPVPPLPAGTPPVNITGPPSAPFSNPSNPASRSESPAIGTAAPGNAPLPPLSAASGLIPGGGSSSIGGGPPSRPGTAVSNASSIDDLLGGPAGSNAAARAGGTMRKKKARGYVNVLADKEK